MSDRIKYALPLNMAVPAKESKDSTGEPEGNEMLFGEAVPPDLMRAFARGSEGPK